MEVHRIHFDSLNSTNTWAKAHFHEFDPKILTCVSAGAQTAGKGRFQRSWHSLTGNLHLSFCFSLPAEDPRIPNLAQMASYVAAHLLKSQNIPVQIKWPNDLILDKKKLAGVLVEAFIQGENTGIIIGIGMNVNTPVEVDQPSTSLFECTHKKWDLDKLKTELINGFLQVLEKGFHTRDLDPLLAFKGEPISCYVGEKRFEGIFLGLTETGQLKLKLSDGSLAELSSGEINTLRTQ